MPHFLKATDIPMSVRKPHLDEYRKQLRRALTDPGLPPGQKARIRARLAHLGKGSPPEAPQAPQYSAEALQSMTKKELRKLASEKGIKVSASWRKQRIIDTLLDLLNPSK